VLVASLLGFRLRAVCGDLDRRNDTDYFRFPHETVGRATPALSTKSAASTASSATSPKTIRYYERIGLLPPARRPGSRFADNVGRLRFIRRARHLGEVGGFMRVASREGDEA
jgi:hypothetical protein